MYYIFKSVHNNRLHFKDQILPSTVTNHHLDTFMAREGDKGKEGKGWGESNLDNSQARF